MEELFRGKEGVALLRVSEDPVDASRGENQRLLVMRLECGERAFKAIEYEFLGKDFDDVGAQSTLKLKSTAKYSEKNKVIFLDCQSCELATLVKKRSPDPGKKLDGPPPFRAFEDDVVARSSERAAEAPVQNDDGPFRSQAKITGLDADGDLLIFCLADVRERRELRTAIAADSLLSFLIPPQLSPGAVIDKLRPAFLDKVFVFEFTPTLLCRHGYQIENISAPAGS